MEALEVLQWRICGLCNMYNGDGCYRRDRLIDMHLGKLNGVSIVTERPSWSLRRVPYLGLSGVTSLWDWVGDGWGEDCHPGDSLIVRPWSWPVLSGWVNFLNKFRRCWLFIVVFCVWWVWGINDCCIELSDMFRDELKLTELIFKVCLVTLKFPNKNEKVTSWIYWVLMWNIIYWRVLCK